MKNLKPRTAQRYFWIIFAVGILAALAGVATEIDALMIIGILIMIMGIVFRVIFYRCPHCGKYLDRSSGEFCPIAAKE